MQNKALKYQKVQQQIISVWVSLVENILKSLGSVKLCFGNKLQE